MRPRAVFTCVIFAACRAADITAETKVHVDGLELRRECDGASCNIVGSANDGTRVSSQEVLRRYALAHPTEDPRALASVAVRVLDEKHWEGRDQQAARTSPLDKPSVEHRGATLTFFTTEPGAGMRCIRHDVDLASGVDHTRDETAARGPSCS